MIAARRWSSLAWRAALAISVATAGLWASTHGVADVTWREVAHVVSQVTLLHLAWLALIWLVGLATYATVLAVALPGLGVRRGLLLNLTGSAVANVFPLGGAVATGLNWRMARVWGHSNGAFVSFCVLTNVLDVMTKLVLPLVAVGLLLFTSVNVPALAWVMVGACAGALLLVMTVNVVWLRAGAAAPSEVGHVPGRLLRLRCNLQDAAARSRGLLATRWLNLLPGSVGYVAAQVLLLYCSLYSVGLKPSLSVVLMGAAIERLTSLVPVTPGGAGLAELGAVAWFVASGLDPVSVVAGVVLYRTFLFALEIPVGGALLGGWAWWHRAGARSYAGTGAPA
jgi:uncharacterized membrane protein YbhN (UPF0104 family)